MLKFLAFREKRIPCIQRHSKFFAFSRNPAFSGKGFLLFTANRKNWHSVKIRQRIPCGFHSAEFLAFSGNPQTIPFIFKNLKIFGIQRKLRGQGGRLLKKDETKTKKCFTDYVLLNFVWALLANKTGILYIFAHNLIHKNMHTALYRKLHNDLYA